MRKLAYVAALVSTVIAVPALARDGAWYVGIEGGPAIVEDQSFNLNGVSDQGSADLKNAWDVDGLVGYDFGGFRLEAELGYKQAALTQWRSQLTTPAGVDAAARPAGTFVDAGGRLSNLSLMLNGLLDFGGEGMAGYIGGGAGIARTKTGYSIDSSGPDFLNDTDSGLAWQAIAGVRAPLSDAVEIGLKYRFFNQDNAKLVDRIGRTAETRYRSHSVLASLIFNFGEAAAPPPPPPPPQLALTSIAI